MSQKLYKVEDIQLLFKELKVEIKKLKCFIEDCCAKIPINVGSGATLFKRLYRNNWEFKSIKEGNNISITSTDNEIVISATAEPTSCQDIKDCLGITPSGNPDKYLNEQGDWELITPSTTGTVTSVSVITNDGVSGTVANPTTTPAITLELGTITPTAIDIVGLGGNGYIKLPAQNTGVPTPTTGTILWADNANRFGWRNPSSYAISLDDTGLSNSRNYTLPNASGTLALTSDLTGGTVTSVAALTLGTTGTDLSSTVANSTTTPTITLNVPTASVANRGVLSPTDWSTFNGKQNALGYTPEDVANKENTTLDTSATKYPTNNLVKTYVDTQIANAPILVSTATASTSTTIDFTLPSGYNSFEVKVISLIPSTDNVAMWIRVSTDGGATFAAGASDYVYQRNIQNGTTAAPALSSPDTKIIILGGNIGNGSGRYFNSIIKIFDPSNASINKNISVDFYAFRSDSVYSIGFVNGVYKFNTAINAIRILMNSGNIASGTFELWGYK